MGMNNWGGTTEHMTKKPRSVFGNKKNLTVSSEFQKKEKLTIDESKIKKSKRKKLILEFLFWYGVPILMVMILIIFKINLQS